MNVGIDEGSAEKALFYGHTSPDWLTPKDNHNEEIPTALAIWLIQELGHSIISFGYPDSERLRLLVEQTLRALIIKDLIKRRKNWV